MNHSNIHIDLLKAGESVPLELLEQADPSRAQINAYLETGECYVARAEARFIGVVVLDEPSAGTVEIMNISVDPSYQRRGIGRRLLQFAERIAREKGFVRLLIGTGNSSISQLALYQSEGFEMVRIEKDYFLKNYPLPIIENGIPCKHRVILEKLLN